MLSEIFSDLDVSTWWKMRACMATFFNAALIVNPQGHSPESMTQFAIDMADRLLEEMGVENPDCRAAA